MQTAAAALPWRETPRPIGVEGCHVAVGGHRRRGSAGSVTCAAAPAPASAARPTTAATTAPSPPRSQLDTDDLTLEFTNPSAGDVEVLEVGIGCVSVHPGEIDDAEQIVERVEQAVEVIGAERIVLNPDCGFAPASAARVDLDEVYRKLQYQVSRDTQIRAVRGHLNSRTPDDRGPWYRGSFLPPEVRRGPGNWGLQRTPGLVRRKEVVLLLGPPGVGKSHLAAGLGVKAVPEGWPGPPMTSQSPRSTRVTSWERGLRTRRWPTGRSGSCRHGRRGDSGRSTAEGLLD